MSIWETIYRFCWLILAVLVLAIVVRLFYPRLRQYQSSQEEKRRLEEDVRVHGEMLNSLRIKQERFHNDPDFLARIAREMGMARPDEMLIRIYDQDHPNNEAGSRRRARSTRP